MPAFLVAIFQKLITSPLSKVGQWALSVIINKAAIAISEAWKDYQRKRRVEAAKKEYEDSMKDPNASLEDRRKKFENYINAGGN